MQEAGRRVVIAVDGPAACGKGTLSKALAARFNLAHLDTGLLYRAAAFKALQQGLPLHEEGPLVALCLGLQAEDLQQQQLRGDEVAQAASKISVLPGVREALKRYPADFSANPAPGYQGAVLDGRDVGTVLCPQADVKLFVTAAPEVRAHRRTLELQQRQGQQEPYDTLYSRVLKDLLERDARDSSRATAPLRPADDAHVLDTSQLSPEGAVEQASQLVREACPWLQGLP